MPRNLVVRPLGACLAVVLALGVQLAAAELAVEPKPDPAGAAEMKAAVNRLSAVTVYPNNALVTREVEVPQGPGPFELIVTPLPPQTLSSSLYSEGGEGIRVLSTRFRTRQLRQDTREDVRLVEEELKTLQMNKEKLDSEVAAVQENMKLLGKLENFTALSTEKGLASESAIAMTKFIMESRVEKHQSLNLLQKQLQVAAEKSEFAKRKLTELASGSSRIEQDAVIVVDKVNPAAGKIRLHYLVNAASWRPQYKLRAGKAAADPVQLEYLGAVMQQTGEAWDRVDLILSTAQPALHAAPPDLQVLEAVVLPHGSPPAAFGVGPHLLEQARTLRSQAQKEFDELKAASGTRLCNSAAALDQSWELLNLNPNNPDARLNCAPGSREGPSVVHHLAQRMSIPSRNDEQVLEVARLELTPEYYHKAIPVLTPHVYRLADLTNKSNYVLLPGEATMHVGTDFVGQIHLPLVAVGEKFTVGFGVDPQLQVQRQLTNKSRTIQGGNQVLNFEYRILIDSYKTERVKLQVWDRLPFAETENINISLLRTAPETNTDALYLREHRPKNLLRWDLVVEPGMNGEKSRSIQYEFKLELDRQMTLGGFSTGVARVETPERIEDPKIRAAMARLSPEDRILAEAQVFCAIKEENRLGSVGQIQKVLVKDRPVFVCCGGCASLARANPDETLARVEKIMARVRAGAR